MKGGDPSISPDERMIVFDADGSTAGDTDLFVSCRTALGWDPPRRFAEPVNSRYEEGDPSVSADGRTLYFFSRRIVSSPDRRMRARRATYTDVQREITDNVLNGSRNVYRVELPSSLCDDHTDARH
jgi:Tol biopolymer transport system component